MKGITRKLFLNIGTQGVQVVFSSYWSKTKLNVQTRTHTLEQATSALGLRENIFKDKDYIENAFPTNSVSACLPPNPPTPSPEVQWREPGTKEGGKSVGGGGKKEESGNGKGSGNREK